MVAAVEEVYEVGEEVFLALEAPDEDRFFREEEVLEVADVGLRREVDVDGDAQCDDDDTDDFYIHQGGAEQVHADEVQAYHNSKDW